MLQGSLPGKDRGSQGSQEAPVLLQGGAPVATHVLFIRETAESPEGRDLKKLFQGNLRPESGWKGTEGSAQGGGFRGKGVPGLETPWE